MRIKVIDSHTGGEPTRVVVEGGPDLGSGPLTERIHRFREQLDHYRSAIVNEPRSSDVVVGALLCPPHAPGCDMGVIFFNNVGYLGMCGHGTIGVVRTLAYLNQIAQGQVKLDTCVGVVTCTLHSDGRVSLDNVPSYRKAAGVTIDVPGVGPVIGDVAWGGNWFYLIEDHGQTINLKNVERLTDYTWKIRQAINQQGYPEIDHIELFGPPSQPGADSRNFVLCPGKAYDRSPCGTGTSAKLACLAAAGKLSEGTPYVQESVIGSCFTGSFRWLDRQTGSIIPTIIGTAHIMAEATLILEEDDPFRWGIGGRMKAEG